MVRAWIYQGAIVAATAVLIFLPWLWKVPLFLLRCYVARIGTAYACAPLPSACAQLPSAYAHAPLTNAYVLLPTTERPPEFEKVTMAVIKKNIRLLQQCLDLQVLIPHLIESGLLTDSQQYDAQNPHLSPQERILKVVQFIGQKGLTGPVIFMQCINKTITDQPGHRDIVEGVMRTVRNDVCTCTDDSRQNNDQERCRQQKEAFANLLLKVQQRLKDCGVTTDDLRLYVSNLPACEFAPENRIIESHLELLQQADSISRILCILTDKGYLAYNSVYILECIVNCDSFWDAKVVTMFKNYCVLQSTSTSTECKDNGKVLCQKFANLVVRALKSLDQVDYDTIRVYVSVLPANLPTEYAHAHFSEDQLDKLAEASNLNTLFEILGFHWDWRSPELLVSILEEFGGELKGEILQYVDELQEVMPVSPEQTQLKRKVREYRIQFARLLIRFFVFMTQASDPNHSLEDFQAFVAHLPASSQLPDVTMFTESAIKAKAGWCETFLSLTHSWDFLNFHTLQCLIEKYGSADLKQSLVTYRDDFLKFAKETKISDLPLPYNQPPPRRGCAKVTLISKANWGEWTLESLLNFRQDISKMFHIELHAVIIYSLELTKPDVFSDSQNVCKLHFYLPSDVACLMLLNSKEEACTRFYYNSKIVKIELSEEGVYYFDFQIGGSEVKLTPMVKQAFANPDLKPRLANLKRRLDMQEQQKQCILM